MTTAPSEAAVKEVVGELAEKAEEIIKAKSAGWPKEASGAADRIVGNITEQVNVLLSGDLSALRDALVRDVASLIKSGKGPVAKQLSDLA